MAFNGHFLTIVKTYIDLINSRNEPMHPTRALFSVGFPDIISKQGSLDCHLEQNLKPFETHSPETLRWHGLPDDNLYTTFSMPKFCASEGWDFQYLDIAPGTGDNSSSFHQLDLNHDLDPSLYSSCDILIDSGTAEHCFNIGKVFENYFHILRPGGFVLQYIPFLSPNHGFWSANPTVFYDLASCNPIKVFLCEMQSFASYRDYFSGNYHRISFSPVNRFVLPSDLSLDLTVLIFAVYKKYKKSPFKYPMQAKYRSQ
ncbi:hypothetical protein [Synechococcus sp. LTW-R]|uniref:hypothetical protein n=1 Tax=Synechococcus sp. LTW-R TaxID=2751170 RepID=UPI0016270892|nr:hypothetical protein [Synechococcus sp. LTW-R]QNG29110.1 hypothetical protein H0O22_10245 [Synechococcus sp. LTW-R]